METSYDPGPLYHYAESEPDLSSSDFVEPAKADDGYLPVDVEYERPKKTSLVLQPAPPRRLSLSSNPDPAPYPSVAPTLPPPRSAEKLEPPAETVRRTWITHIGLLGLVGLAGLGGAAIGGSSSSGSPLASRGGSECIVGTIAWSASTLSIPGYAVADGSAVDVDKYPDFVQAVGETTPDLIGRYARGGLDAGATMDASVDAQSLSVRIDDPGHSHVESTAYSVVRDGQYSLAHLYSFTTSGINLKDSGPGIVAARTGISASIEGGTETRPASVVLIPHVCIGAPKDGV